MSEKEIAVDVVTGKILVVRGKRVMLDRDLAELYRVETKQLIRQMKRNIKRFPEDFMYQLTRQEVANLKCHFGTSSWGGTRKLPYVFTEQGVAMLSGLLNSDRAIHVNIAIMRAFVRIGQVLLVNKEMAEKLEDLERKYQLHESDIQVIFEAIKKLIEPPDEPPKPRFEMN
jgi:hypothetical protein